MTLYAGFTFSVRDLLCDVINYACKVAKSVTYGK